MTLRHFLCDKTVFEKMQVAEKRMDEEEYEEDKKIQKM